MQELPKLMLGTSPFIGAGQFGAKAIEYRKQFYDKPESMERLFIKSYELGVNAVQLIAYEPLVNALANTEQKIGKFFKVVTAIENFDYCLKLVNKLEPEYIAVHAIFSDIIDERLKQWIEKIKKTGAKPAASTHVPGRVLPALEKFDFEVYLAPLNPLGYAMRPNFESSLKAIKNTRKRVIAMKSLAAGRLIPEKSLFKFIYRYADAVAVGITSEKEMVETYLQAMIAR